jgi:16S rRNA (guanine(966)-N(2))-methyltransferase RsmD
VRIVSGKYKGRHLHPPAGLPVRPTTDMAKVSLFNILNNYFDFEKLKVLDLFSGTGNITLEFISRGCSDITSIDSHFKCIQFIKEQSVIMEIRKSKAVKADVFGYLKKCSESFDLIFADPPYDMQKTNDIPEIIFSRKLLNPEGWLIIEHSSRTNFTTHINFSEHRKYGNANFSIFKNLVIGC